MFLRGGGCVVRVGIWGCAFLSFSVALGFVNREGGGGCGDRSSGGRGAAAGAGGKT